MRHFRRGFTLTELMFVVAIIGLLAALAIPAFMRFQSKSKTAEPRTNLKGLFTAQSSYFAEKDSYGVFTQVGWEPERGNRYAYYLSATPAQSQERTATSLATPTAAPGYDAILVDCLKLTNGACTATVPGNPTAGGLQALVTPTYTNNPGVTGPATAPGLVTGSTGAVLVRAVGNIDNDTGNDSWEVSAGESITTVGGNCTIAQNAGSGIPVNTWNDVDCD